LKTLEQFNIGTRTHLNDYYGELKNGYTISKHR